MSGLSGGGFTSVMTTLGVSAQGQSVIWGRAVRYCALVFGDCTGNLNRLMRAALTVGEPPLMRMADCCRAAAAALPSLAARLVAFASQQPGHGRRHAAGGVWGPRVVAVTTRACCPSLTGHPPPPRCSRLLAAELAQLDRTPPRPLVPPPAALQSSLRMCTPKLMATCAWACPSWMPPRPAWKTPPHGW
jgi:hypothetical protein